jgi:hypothetical protein
MRKQFAKARRCIEVIAGSLGSWRERDAILKDTLQHGSSRCGRPGQVLSSLGKPGLDDHGAQAAKLDGLIA